MVLLVADGVQNLLLLLLVLVMLDDTARPDDKPDRPATKVGTA